MEFKIRDFKEVKGGKYDIHGFYHTPNGSFWDCDGIYFNKEGKDSHGGYYDENLEYHPGENWIEKLMCYEDEIDHEKKQEILDNSNEYNEDDNEYEYEDKDYNIYEDINEDMEYGNLNGPSYYEYNKNNDMNKTNTSKFKNDRNSNKKVIENNKNVNKYDKEKINIDILTNKLVINKALNNNNNISFKGYKISQNLTSDDEDNY